MYWSSEALKPAANGISTSQGQMLCPGGRVQVIKAGPGGGGGAAGRGQTRTARACHAAQEREKQGAAHKASAVYAEHLLP